MKESMTNVASFLLELGSYDEDDLKVLRFESTERLSRPFELRIELASRNPDLDFEAIVGQTAAFTMRGPEGDRFLHGVAAEFEQGGATAKHYFYEVVLRPRLWLLENRSNCRIFQDESIDAILSKVLEEHGLLAGQDFEFQLAGVHKPREYCVQYRESDLAFLQRLCEEEGVFFFFKSDADRSQVIFGDSPSAHEDIAGDSELRMAPPGGLVSAELVEQVFDLRFSQRVRSGAFATTDYEFKQPTLDLSASKQADKNTELEIFDFPGEYAEPDVGQAIAQVRLEEQQARRKETRGSSNSIRFSPGAKFILADHPREDFNHGYLLTELRQKGASPQALEEDVATGGEARYSNTFVAIPDDVPYRPARETPRPTVQGAQTAVVVGPGGEEIYCDEHGRVKVQFFWDRYGQADQNSSCWIRVSHHWADAGWGFVVLPRIGQEVIIDFLEGDPDQPILTGRVFNGDKMPPNELPADKSKMTIRSQSLGGSGGSNEITMDDTGGQEQFYEHAQFDFAQVVEHDRFRRVGNDETVSVEHDRSDSVSNNETRQVGANRVRSVGANETITVGSNVSRTIGVNETITVGTMRTAAIGVNDSTTVGGAQEITVGAARAVSVGGTQVTSVGVSLTEQVGGSRTIETGNDASMVVGGDHKIEIEKTSKLMAKKDIVISSEDQIVLKAGKSSITLKKDGTILIEGKDITIKGSGKINVKASSKVTIKGSQVAAN